MIKNAVWYRDENNRQSIWRLTVSDVYLFILYVTFPLDFAFKLMRVTRKIKNEIIWLNGEFFPKNNWTSDRFRVVGRKCFRSIISLAYTGNNGICLFVWWRNARPLQMIYLPLCIHSIVILTHRGGIASKTHQSNVWKATIFMCYWTMLTNVYVWEIPTHYRK